MTWNTTRLVALFSIGLLGTLGCQQQSAAPVAKPAGEMAHEHARDSQGQDAHGGHEHTGHGHGAGPHGGVLADWGGGKYHVEFTVDHDQKEATVYVLGTDEKTASAVNASDGRLLLSIREPVFQVELIAVPQEGEAEGTSSRFVGQHEKLGTVQEFAGTISGAIDGIPYTADFNKCRGTYYTGF